MKKRQMLRMLAKRVEAAKNDVEEAKAIVEAAKAAKEKSSKKNLIAMLTLMVNKQTNIEKLLKRILMLQIKL